MIALELIIERIHRTFSVGSVKRIENPGPAAQHSLLVESGNALEIARFLRDEPGLQFDFCSNVTGVDWLDREVDEILIVKELVDGETKEVKTKTKRTEPGYLEAVYHLYSVSLKHGPLVLRLRTGDRAQKVHLPSLTPIWKSAELQEREVYDLYGIHFGGHPDLRRLLLWEDFEGHPMRKDFVLPDEDTLPEELPVGPQQRGGADS